MKFIVSFYSAIGAPISVERIIPGLKQLDEVRNSLGVNLPPERVSGVIREYEYYPEIEISEQMARMEIEVDFCLS